MGMAIGDRVLVVYSGTDLKKFIKKGKILESINFYSYCCTTTVKISSCFIFSDVT